MEFRHEVKHRISYADMLALRARLPAVMARDEHAGDGGQYEIKSLYFDDARDTALLDKLNGVNRRDKFRIRCYNGDTALLHLEKKSKINDLCKKQTAELTAEECARVIAGEWSFLRKEGPLKAEFAASLASGLAPKAVVSYTREPFVFPAGNVRVTLDYDIRTGLQPAEFLRRGVSLPVPDDAIILEVKWDEFLPDVIRDAIQLPARRASAYSKYAACRAYNY